jgi:uncharacterized protein DUF4232/uncharacterized protein DUF3298
VKHRVLAALCGTVVIVGMSGCATSGTGATISSTPQAASASPTAAAAPSPCDAVGGKIDPDTTCHVHTETPSYTLDFRFPLSYPDMQAVTDEIVARRDQFVDWLKQYPVPGGVHSALNIGGRAFESSSTRSLVLDIETEGGVHPVTTFKAFNYDIDKKAAITFDTLFKPGADIKAVLTPIVQRELDKRQGSDVSAADADVDTYRNFAITDDAVTFFINQDGAFPHYVGSLEVPVPRSDLAPLLAGSDSPAPCASGQVAVTAGQPQAAAGHRAVTLAFGLVPGAGSCTLSGYPGVDTGSGGPRMSAQRQPRGYMGGLPEGNDTPPVVTVSPSAQAHAVVEGLAIDQSGSQCPTYTELLVTPPNTTETSTVPTTIDACVLIVHPVTA